LATENKDLSKDEKAKLAAEEFVSWAVEKIKLLKDGETISSNDCISYVFNSLRNEFDQMTCRA